MKIYKINSKGVKSEIDTSDVITEEVAVTTSPQQIYTRYDVIQEREDIVPSRLRSKRRRKKKKRK